MTALQLQPRRTWLLMKNDVRTSVRELAIGVLATSGVIFVLYMFISIFGSTESGAGFHTTVFTNFLLLGGFIVSSMAFRDLHDERRGLHYLTLPGSTLEKFVGRLLLTSVGWVIAVIIAVTATTALGAGISSLVAGRSLGVFLPLTKGIWTTVASYLVAQGIFLFGSTYFKKSAFLKTVLASVLAGIAFGVFMVFAGRLVFFDSFARFMPTDQEMSALAQRLLQTNERLESVLLTLGRIVGWGVVPVFFAFAGYLRLKETEV